MSELARYSLHTIKIYSVEEQIQFLSGASSFSDAQFGQGSGDIVFDNLQCTGNESSLFRCLTINQCSHTEDAGVRCQDNGEPGLLWPVMHVGPDYVQI